MIFKSRENAEVVVKRSSNNQGKIPKLGSWSPKVEGKLKVSARILKQSRTGIANNGCLRGVEGGWKRVLVVIFCGILFKNGQKPGRWSPSNEGLPWKNPFHAENPKKSRVSQRFQRGFSNSPGKAKGFREDSQKIEGKSEVWARIPKKSRVSQRFGQ